MGQAPVFERAMNSGIVFSLKQIASIADVFGNKLIVTAITEILDKGTGPFIFKDL